MLSNIELTERLEVLEEVGRLSQDIRESLQQQIDDQQERIQTLDHEVKILKRTIGMGNLEQIPPADYELSADTCQHLNWDRDYENDLRICKNCGHQEALY